MEIKNLYKVKEKYIKITDSIAIKKWNTDPPKVIIACTGLSTKKHLTPLGSIKARGLELRYTCDTCRLKIDFDAMSLIMGTALLTYPEVFNKEN